MKSLNQSKVAGGQSLERADHVIAGAAVGEPWQYHPPAGPHS